jgi:serine/threonine-protein kinase
LTARVPPPPLPESVPAAVEAIVRCALTHDVESRYATAAELHTALEEAMKHAEVPTSVHDLASYVAQHTASRVAARKEAIALGIKSAAERSRVAALLDAHVEMTTAAESPVTAPGVGEASVGTLATASLDTLQESRPGRKARTWIATGTAAGMVLGIGGWAFRWAHPSAVAPATPAVVEEAPPAAAPTPPAADDEPSSATATTPVSSAGESAAALARAPHKPVKRVVVKPKSAGSSSPLPRKRKVIDDGF